jgi:hypothetical protein
VHQVLETLISFAEFADYSTPPRIDQKMLQERRRTCCVDTCSIKRKAVSVPPATQQNAWQRVNSAGYQPQPATTNEMMMLMMI